MNLYRNREDSPVELPCIGAEFGQSDTVKRCLLLKTNRLKSALQPRFQNTASSKSMAGRSRVEALIVCALLIVLGLMWGGIVITDNRYQNSETAQAMRSTTNVARIFEEHAVRTLSAIDQVLEDMAQGYQAQGKRFDLHDLLQRRKLDPSLFESVAIADEHGDMVLTSPPMARSINIGDREHFQEHRSKDSGKLVVGKPLVARLTQRSGSTLSRRINKSDGSFGGMATLVIDPEYFRSFYAQVDVGDNGVIALSGRDGIVRVRYNGQSREVGQDIGTSRVFELLQSSPTGSYLQNEPMDGVARIVSYRALRDYPLIVTVSITQDSVLAYAREEGRVRYLIAALSSCMLVLGVWFLLMALRRRERDALALAVSERRFRSVLDGIPDRVWMKDAEGRYLALNRAHEQAIGLPVTDVLGKFPRDFLSPQNAAAIEAEDRKVAESMLPMQFERRSFDDFDAWVDIVKVPICDAEGRLTGVLATVRDITARVVAQERASSSERLLLQLMTNTQEGFWHIDNAQVTINVNPAMCALLGRPREDIIGRDIYAFVDEQNAQVFRDQRLRREAGEEASYEITLTRPDGSQVHCMNSVTVIYDGSGRMVGAVGLCIDVAPLKQVQADLEAARQQAVSANEAKTLFLSTMSHEIRTPLAGILGMAELLQCTALSPQQHGYCEAIAKSGAGLHDLLSNILDLNRIDEGMVPLEKIDFNLRQLLEELSSVYAEVTSASKNRFEARFGEGLPTWVCGDPTRLRQVLNNLLGNANKFAQGGDILFAADVLPDAGAPGIARLRFRVKDTGLGIAAEHMRNLFQRFVQADGSIQRRFGGSGLGLAISKHLVELMGGSIQVASEAGQGADFWFDVPMPLSAGLAQVARPQSAATGVEGARVLLAEDHPINQQIMCAILRQAGAEVRVVDNGEQAVEAMFQGEFDIVLMDCQMPLMSGYDATRRIRARESNGQHIPIVAITANAFAENKEKCLEAGMDDFLAKPVAGNVLIQTLATWIGARNSPAGARAAAAATQGIETAMADTLFAELGPEATVQVIELYLARAPGDVASLRQCVIDQDLLAFGQLLHGLKSSSQLLGGTRIGELAQLGDDLALAGKASAFDVHTEITAAVAAFCESLRAHPGMRAGAPQ